MKLLLTETTTVVITTFGFYVYTTIKKGENPLELLFKGSIIESIDAKRKNSCSIVFNDDNGKHILVLTDYEEPLLDDEFMFI